jgi:DNA modification methylase
MSSNVSSSINTKKNKGKQVFQLCLGEIIDNICDPVTDEEVSAVESSEQSEYLLKIEELDKALSQHFERKIIIEPTFTRQIVSFQANKKRPAYRWYKYKEAFSASLIEFVYLNYGITKSAILDPFAGSGTTLFTASDHGMESDGIELLPIGQEIINARICLEREFERDDFRSLERWMEDRPWRKTNKRNGFRKLRITDGAYPPDTLKAIESFLGVLDKENDKVQRALRFALLCVLESVSYTRKDGQYLRWDHRSGRKQGDKLFDKGNIPGFDEAICGKINEILHDLKNKDTQNDLFTAPEKPKGSINLFNGSCLDVLPRIPKNTYNTIITSPPYCNRYDYTRTYALELAMLGVDEQELSGLRQSMLSCTVENRAKDLIGINPQWKKAVEAADKQDLLQAVIKYLEIQKNEGKLNNNSIPRMVRGYFYEMACVISECFRVMKKNARLIMVNDNVRYAGASISVDMILSNIAEILGFKVENILVLPNGKGNSSQQMGTHGRTPLRKCVYVWRKG